VASVLEGSAVAAIGTDTGGSIRVPAMLGGLVGYRASLYRGDWRGGYHLAKSFDTMGWLFRDLRDAPLFASLFAPHNAPLPRQFARFAYVADSFLTDCEPEIIESFHTAIRELESLGLRGSVFEPDWWRDSREIYAPIQAYEAAQYHAGNFAHIQPDIRERLELGAAITKNEIIALRKRRSAFFKRMQDLFAAHELIMLPCAPVATLEAGADHSKTRPRLLRYTTPFSLAGVPTVAIPCAHGGAQLAAKLGDDESLLALAAQLGEHRAANGAQS
jgi:aspartyl-tRNA(Asn)/glutamyl-tRNA(Gln) amidotransferase subunit A